MILLTISTPLLIGIFLLCCTSVADRACKRLSIAPGSVAAISLLTALLSGVIFQPWRILSIHPVSLLLILGAFFHAKKCSAYCLLTAFTGGMLGWLLLTLFPAFMEPCIFTALPSAVLALFFMRNRREALVTVLLAPLLASGFTTLSDWYLFDDGIFTLGSAGQLDAQVCGVLLYGLLLSAPEKKSTARNGFHQNEA